MTNVRTVRIPYLSELDVLLTSATACRQTPSQRSGMGSPQHADHYYTGLRAGFDQSPKNSGVAFLLVCESNREADKILPRLPPRRTPAVAAAPDSKKRGARGTRVTN